MKLEYVQAKVAAIWVAGVERHDCEAAHSMEDSLYREVLAAVAAGAGDAAELAAAALKATDLDFVRWYA